METFKSSPLEKNEKRGLKKATEKAQNEIRMLAKQMHSSVIAVANMPNDAIVLDAARKNIERNRMRIAEIGAETGIDAASVLREYGEEIGVDFSEKIAEKNEIRQKGRSVLKEFEDARIAEIIDEAREIYGKAPLQDPEKILPRSPEATPSEQRYEASDENSTFYEDVPTLTNMPIREKPAKESWWKKAGQGIGNFFKSKFFRAAVVTTLSSAPLGNDSQNMQYRESEPIYASAKIETATSKLEKNAVAHPAAADMAEMHTAKKIDSSHFLQYHLNRTKITAEKTPDRHETKESGMHDRRAAAPAEDNHAKYAESPWDTTHTISDTISNVRFVSSTKRDTAEKQAEEKEKGPEIYSYKIKEVDETPPKVDTIKGSYEDTLNDPRYNVYAHTWKWGVGTPDEPGYKQDTASLVKLGYPTQMQLDELWYENKPIRMPDDVVKVVSTAVGDLEIAKEIAEKRLDPVLLEAFQKSPTAFGEYSHYSLQNESIGTYAITLGDTMYVIDKNNRLLMKLEAKIGSDVEPGRYKVTLEKTQNTKGKPVTTLSVAGKPFEEIEQMKKSYQKALIEQLTGTENANPGNYFYDIVVGNETVEEDGTFTSINKFTGMPEVTTIEKAREKIQEEYNFARLHHEDNFVTSFLETVNNAKGGEHIIVRQKSGELVRQIRQEAGSIDPAIMESSYKYPSAEKAKSTVSRMRRGETGKRSGTAARSRKTRTSENEI